MTKTLDHATIPPAPRPGAPATTSGRSPMRLAFCGMAVIGALLAGASHAGAAEPLTEVGTDGCNLNVAINNAVGQSFQVPSAAILDHIDIWMKPELYYDTSYEVRLYDGDGTGGTLLATSDTLDLGSLTDGEPTGWRSFPFDLSTVLQPNHTYTLQLTRLSQYSGAFALCSNVYAGGKLYWLGSYPMSYEDMAFSVHGITNLLQNGSGDTDDMSGWTITQNGGNGWVVNNAFYTSYDWDRRMQLVDLLALGFDTQYLDAAPPIHVSEKFLKSYCPDFYELKVELLDASMTVIDTFHTGVLQHAGTCSWDSEWEQVSFTFTDYGPGVRYVRWQDGGKDAEWWAGHYGTVLDDAVLTID